jgi:hypothetical protein
MCLSSGRTATCEEGAFPGREVSEFVGQGMVSGRGGATQGLRGLGGVWCVGLGSGGRMLGGVGVGRSLRKRIAGSAWVD